MPRTVVSQRRRVVVTSRFGRIAEVNGLDRHLVVLNLTIGGFPSGALRCGVGATTEAGVGIPQHCVRRDREVQAMGSGRE